MKVSDDNNNKCEPPPETNNNIINKEKSLVKTNTAYQKVSKRNSIKVKSRLIIQIDDSLNLLTSIHYCPLNYSIQYNILSSSFKSF